MPRVPNIKAAVKWTRQSEKRRKRNLDTKTRLKTIFKKAKTSGDPATVATVESQFDKAAQKGIIHPNKAARKKSRLAKAARAALVAKPAVVKAPAKAASAKAAPRKKAAAK
jgi:small subunit ribosomal protein S20